MRVVCPYVPWCLRRGTIDSLRAQAPHAEFVDVSATPESYYDLFARTWAAAEDFTIVEHDIVIASGTIAAFDECPEPWCSAPIGVSHAHTGSSEAYFQCNRWRREMMLALPDVPDISPADRHWSELDSYLRRRMRPYQSHSHLDRMTFHLAPYLGSAL